MINFILAFLVCGSSYAKGTVGGTSITSSEVSKDLTPQEFAGRFQVSGDLFVTSADGKRLLYRISESRTGKPLEDNVEIYSNWGHYHKVGDKTVGIFIRYSFQIQKDGSVKVHIQQFESMSPGSLNGVVKYGKLIREEKTDLIDFAPINWLAYKDSDMRIIARITPLLLDKGGSFGPDNLPIALNQAVLVDSTGKLWGDDLSEGGGKFVALATHKGTLALSYYPFKGAKEIGVAKGNEMLLTGLKPSLTLRNTKPFLTANGEMKVYGMVLPERKTEHLHSINMVVTDKEPEFLERLK
jgi:hypothetical protein